jgi:hypothetical protein
MRVYANLIRYWPNLLAKQYMNRRSGFLSFDWSISKNLIAINVDKAVRMYLLPYIAIHANIFLIRIPMFEQVHGPGTSLYKRNNYGPW